MPGVFVIVPSPRRKFEEWQRVCACAQSKTCLVGLVVRHWTAVLEVVGSIPALAKQIIKFLGFLRLPARVGL